VTSYKKKRLQEKQVSWAQQILASALAQGWWGTITIKIEAGAIKRVVKAESLVPPD